MVALVGLAGDDPELPRGGLPLRLKFVGSIDLPAAVFLGPVAFEQAVAQPVDQGVYLGVGVTHGVEVEVLGLERPERLGERLVVPLGQFGGAVVGDGVGRGVGSSQVGADDLDLVPTEGTGRRQRAVAGQHDVAPADDHGLLLPELGQAALDGFKVALGVPADVGRVQHQQVYIDGLDLHLQPPFFLP